MIRGGIEEEQEDDDQDDARIFLLRNGLRWHYVYSSRDRSFIVRNDDVQRWWW